MVPGELTEVVTFVNTEVESWFQPPLSPFPTLPLPIHFSQFGRVLRSSWGSCSGRAQPLLLCAADRKPRAERTRPVQPAQPRSPAAVVSVPSLTAFLKERLQLGGPRWEGSITQ